MKYINILEGFPEKPRKSRKPSKTANFYEKSSKKAQISEKKRIYCSSMPDYPLISGISLLMSPL
jgi:hypothetical protein